MQYAGSYTAVSMRFVKDSSSWNGKDTMNTKNPLYQGNMGQLTGLSFENIKAINLAYCADRCSPSSLARPCQHAGYQDPNDCRRCVCPDGFGGQYCDQIASPTHGQCSLLSHAISLFHTMVTYAIFLAWQMVETLCAVAIRLARLVLRWW